MRRTAPAKVAAHSDKICCVVKSEIDHFLCPEMPLDQLRELSPEVVFKFVKSIKTGSIRSLRARVLLRARWDPRVPGASHRCSALSLTALWHRLGAARLARAPEP